METLLMLIVYLIVGAVLIYIVQLLLGMLTLPAQVKTAILVIISLVFLLFVLRFLGLLVF